MISAFACTTTKRTNSKIPEKILSSMGKNKGSFGKSSSVTLRLFQGANEGSVFEVVKVSGEPKNIDIDALVDAQPDDDSCSQSLTAKPETFDGYFPEDGYDYSQHLREIDQARFIPRSRKEQDKPQIDSRNHDLAEVMTALQSSEDPKTEDISDEFFDKLGTLDERTRLGLLWGEDQVDEYLEMPTDKLMAIQARIKQREMKSMVPAIPSQEEAEFEAFFAREFGDAKIGGLCSEDVQIDEDALDDSVSEDDSDDSVSVMGKTEEDFDTIRADGLEETRKFIQSNTVLQVSVMDAPDDGLEVVVVPESKKPEWDCESVLSSRSNIFNHPGKILRPPRENRAKPSLDAETLTPVAEDVEEEMDTPVISTFRPKDETSEERRARKQAIKQFQREQREVKNAEKKKHKEMLNKSKIQTAVRKHQSYGDVPIGVSRFSI